MDFSDVSQFNGVLMYVYDIRFKDITSEILETDISCLKCLFGPMSINRPPNTKGKNSWKLIRELSEVDIEIPAFKATQFTIALDKALNWNLIDEWYVVRNFTDKSHIMKYNKVRELETLFLYDKKDISIRATMHYLIELGKPVFNYYDLSLGRYRELYLLHINTAFTLKRSQELIKNLPPRRYI